MRTKDAKTPLKAMSEIYTIDGVEYQTINISKLSNYYKEWANDIKQLNFEIKKACYEEDSRFITNVIENYCGHEYVQINSYLRSRKDIETNEYREKAHLLSLQIYLAPRLPINTFVYRSISNSFFDQLILNGRKQEFGFMSTTLDLTYAEDFKDDNSILKIYVEKNVPCIFTDVIKNRNESELLFPPCGVLSVVSAPIKTTRTGKRLCECKLFYF